MPRLLICGNIVWAHQELKNTFEGIADVVNLDTPNRTDFLAAFSPGEKYHDVVGIYRHNSSADRVGIFDASVIQVLAQANVKWIAHNGAGYDQIDVLECKRLGISVSNTPHAVDDATATTALYLVVSTLRIFSPAERSLRALTWKSTHQAGRAHDPTGCTLAILGLGGIGLRLAELVHAWPMRVVYTGRSAHEDVPSWCEYFGPQWDGERGVAAMLAQTDVLSVHLPLNGETEGYVGAKWIRALKKGAIVVNTARGKVIDEEALISALEEGHLASAGLDVYPDEPNVNPRLLAFPQLTLLPHMGTENQDAQRLMEVRALTNLHDFLVDGKGKDLVVELRQARL